MAVNVIFIFETSMLRISGKALGGFLNFESGGNNKYMRYLLVIGNIEASIIDKRPHESVNSI